MICAFKCPNHGQNYFTPKVQTDHSCCSEDSPSCYQAPGSCGPSWSLAVAWAPLRWRSASWGHSSADQRSWTSLKNPCQTCQSHLARCLWASAEVDRRTRRRTKVTHRSHSYSSDSLELNGRTIRFTHFSLNYIYPEIDNIVKLRQSIDDSSPIRQQYKHMQHYIMMTTRWKQRATFLVL